MTINTVSLPSHSTEQQLLEQQSLDPNAPIDVQLLQDADYRKSVAEKVVRATCKILKVFLALIVLGSIVAGVVCSIMFATPIYALGITVSWAALLLPCLAPTLIRKLYPVEE